MASAQDLATRLGKYYYLLEKNNAKLRTMPRSDVTAVYDALYKEWHFPNIDAEERRKYFAICEEICNSIASTAKEYYVLPRSFIATVLIANLFKLVYRLMLIFFYCLGSNPRHY